MTEKEKRMIGRIQDLAGKAKSTYENDRELDRAGKLIPLLEEIFGLALRILSKYPPSKAGR